MGVTPEPLEWESLSPERAERLRGLGAKVSLSCSLCWEPIEWELLPLERLRMSLSDRHAYAPTGEHRELPPIREEFHESERKPSKRKRGSTLPFRLLGWILFTGLLIDVALLGAIYSNLDSRLGDLPPNKFLDEYRPQVPSRILAADQDSLIGEVFSPYQNRLPVTIDEMPEELIQALVALEDKRFFGHPGISPRGVLRSAVTNLRAGGIREGASTITLLLAKDLYLKGEEKGGRRRTFEQKFNEVFHALQIERTFSKEEILERYFNQVEMGSNVIGVGKWAEHYFGKKVGELNLRECALFAAMQKAPNRYSPLKRDPTRSINRTNLTLGEMLEEGFVTQEEYERAIKEPLRLATDKTRVGQKWNYPYITDYVRYAFEREKRYRSEAGHPLMLEGTGYDVVTTIEPALQDAAVLALRSGLRNTEWLRRYQHGRLWGKKDYQGVNGHAPKTLQHDVLYDAKIVNASKSVNAIDVVLRNIDDRTVYEVQFDPKTAWLDDFNALQEDFYVSVKLAPEADRENPVFVLADEENDDERHVQGGMIALQPSTGKILALVGGRDYFDAKNAGQFNRVIRSEKLPGSAFKPLLYAAAVVEGGFNPASILIDEERTYGVGPNAWTPRNYHAEFHGEVTMEFALAKSLNASSVFLLDNLMGRGARTRGFATLRRFCRDTFDLNLSQSNLSMALGTNVMTPYEMAKAYGVFASGGRFIEPYVVDRVRERRRGERDLPKELYRHKARHTRVMDRSDAAVITSLLTGPATYGTAKRLAQDFPGIPLAGKTGTTDYCVTAWFAGYARDLVCVVYVGFDKYRSLGTGMTGARVALPIWIAFMQKALVLHPELFGEMPKTPGVREIRICRTSGQLACSRCPEENIAVVICRLENGPTDECPVHGEGSTQHLAHDVRIAIDRVHGTLDRSRSALPVWRPVESSDSSQSSPALPVEGEESRVGSDDRPWTPIDAPAAVRRARPPGAESPKRPRKNPDELPASVERDIRTILTDPEPTPTSKPKKRRWWRR